MASPSEPEAIRAQKLKDILEYTKSELEILIGRFRPKIEIIGLSLTNKLLFTGESRAKTKKMYNICQKFSGLPVKIESRSPVSFAVYIEVENIDIVFKMIEKKIIKKN